MTSFDVQLEQFADNAERRLLDTFVLATQEARRSVVEGSPLTGAPGQPVDTGTLIGSFIEEFRGALVWELTSRLRYALPIEEGKRMSKGNVALEVVFSPPGQGSRIRNGRDRKSKVGGYGSIARTIAAWPDIVSVSVIRAGGTQ